MGKCQAFGDGLPRHCLRIANKPPLCLWLKPIFEVWIMTNWKYRYAALLAASLSTATGSGVAGGMTGEVFLDLCTKEKLLCQHYSVGVMDGAHMVAWAANLRLHTCPPNTVSGEQIGEVVLKYLKDHPEELSRRYASYLVNKALVEAFPCREDK